ncbi:MAG TPA: hypothetical protein PLC76_03250 [Saprospiraceae bacterium]|jgi:hypothetical protein|nr:MAG: hypothetical protein UZ08_BCD001000812 [Candidatus Parvibacillus calidus]MCC7148394.1 hypothetical protein [Saprospiraceae bacterium]MBK7739132.1 hypothetical protein [Candidatus Parvibacillus calidus]MCO6471468.1 hypothetical protein [Saprospiraceae bacterium]WKZ63271.1 MAG: hypothetical protein QY315_00500 [Saprospiraceae bacterium]
MSKFLRPFLFFTLFIASCSSCKDDEGFGPFQDKFPVVFNFLDVRNETVTHIFTSDGTDVEYLAPERENELNEQMHIARNQVEYIKLLGPDQSEIKGKYRDGITEVVLDARYSLSGSDYTFSKDLITQVLTYKAKREADTMTMKGICCVRYNNGERKDRSTVIQVSGYTLQDEKNEVEAGDTLYYRLFDVRLIKKL